jgi:Transmembrane Fragile-X-F protein
MTSGPNTSARNAGLSRSFRNQTLFASLLPELDKETDMAVDLDSYKAGLMAGIKQAPTVIVKKTSKVWPWSGLLFVVFLVLKLTNTIDWSWWIVTLPLWIMPAAYLAVIGVVIAIIVAILIIVGLVALGVAIFGR